MRAMDTVVTIKEFFDAPQVMTSWRLNRKDHNLVRFGLLWRIDDLVLRKGISYKVPTLSVLIKSNLFLVTSLVGKVVLNFLFVHEEFLCMEKTTRLP